MSFMNEANNYDKVCADEALRVLRNFLPYSTGAIENKQTHYYKSGFKDPLPDMIPISIKRLISYIFPIAILTSF